MSEPPDPAHEFAAHLRALYEAADRPDLATLVRQGKGQSPPVVLNDSTLSGWLNGVSVPSKAKHREFGFLVAFLEGLAKERTRKHPSRGVAWWIGLHNRVWQQTRINRGGRPRTRHPDGETPAGGDATSDRSNRPDPLRSAVQSAYLEQVKRIAPPRLTGRQKELAELAAFCLDAHHGPYVWWQAAPWAGKSALMSTLSDLRDERRCLPRCGVRWPVGMGWLTGSLWGVGGWMAIRSCGCWASGKRRVGLRCCGWSRRPPGSEG